PLALSLLYAHELLLLLFSNDPTTSLLYTLSLHDALPICPSAPNGPPVPMAMAADSGFRKVRRGAMRLWFSSTCSMASGIPWPRIDRKSTRLNSSHRTISYAVFCLKKKKLLCTASRRRE